MHLLRKVVLLCAENYGALRLDLIDLDFVLFFVVFVLFLVVFVELVQLLQADETQKRPCDRRLLA